MADGKVQDIRLVYGGVAPVPLRVSETEAYLKGKELTEDVLEQSAAIAVQDACSFDKNDYKIQEMKALLKKALGMVK